MPIGNPVTLTSNVASKTISVTATASQTLFNVTGGYRINSLGVFKNGLRLQDGVDYTARDGLTVTLLSAASGGDKLQFVVFDTFRVAEAIRPNVDEQTIRGNLNVVGILSASTLEGLSNFNLTSGITTFNDVRVGGALTVAGVLTFDDVTNVDSVGYATFRSGVNVQGAGSTTTTLNVTGIATIGAGLTMGDNVKAFFGNDGELQIFSNGTNPTIDAISGDLLIRNLGTSGDIYLDAKSGERGIKIIQDGAVEIYHDNSKKFETTSSGINVTGITTATELDIKDSSSNEPSLKLSTGTATNFFSISRSSSTGHYTFASEENGSRIIFSTDPDGNGTQERLTIDRYGHVGINTVPSGWEAVADTTALQIDGASVACINDTDFFATSNAYWDGSNWKYIQTGEAVSYYQYNDERKHIFRSAASGSPGNNISWTNQLVIDAGGNLNITGITTATQLFEGTTRVATTGKAIAMAMLFG